MSNINCDEFSLKQFVTVTQTRTLYSLYVGTREERKEHGGLGCLMSDLTLSGEAKPMSVKDVLARGLRRTNGKKIRAFELKGGVTYILVGRPMQAQRGVFIVPPGNRYTYTYKGAPLTPGTCLLYNGGVISVIPWQIYRKLYVMASNPVSSGRMKEPREQELLRAPTSRRTPFPGNAGTATPYKGIGFDSALRDTGASTPTVSAPQAAQTLRLRAVGRIFRQNELVGLALSDGQQTRNIPLASCISYAQQGHIENVKAVTRDGGTFLMGNGAPLDTLPIGQV
ncbi:hypothetical protein FACS1894208_00860 [Clostridia bacterium]|nr:hypothetical protein FACS1894208_00860 [Clostridia bacterium]